MCKKHQATGYKEGGQLQSTSRDLATLLNGVKHDEENCPLQTYYVRQGVGPLAASQGQDYREGLDVKERPEMKSRDYNTNLEGGERGGRRGEPIGPGAARAQLSVRPYSRHFSPRKNIRE